MKKFFTKRNSSLTAVTLILSIVCVMMVGCDVSNEVSYEIAVKEVLPGVDLNTGKEIPVDGDKYPESVIKITEYDNGYAIETEVVGKRDMKVLVGIGKDGAVTGVYITENKETPEHFSKVEPQLIGKDGKYSGMTSDSLEAEIISGATLSSEGIYNAVKASLEAYEALCADGVAENVENFFNETLYAVNELI